MKIAYFFFWNDSPNSGVIKKVRDQVTFWKNEEHIINIFILTQRNSLFHQQFDKLQNDDGITWNCLDYSSFIERNRQSDYLFQTIKNFEPDIVYLRKCKFSPGIYRVLKNYPSIMELNGKPKPFKYLTGSVYDWLTLRMLLKSVKGFVSVANEVAETYYYATYKKPIIIIGNSIDQSRYDVLPPNNKDTDLTFVYIGSPNQYWQGVDKILNVSKLRPSWVFHIIGIKPSELGYENDALLNVVFYGKKDSSEYLEIFQKSDVAFDSLARHRRSMNEISTLKMREYLTCGLPVVTGHKDPDFKGDEPYILELPNYEHNVVDHLDQIESFARKWKGKRVDRSQVDHIDVRHKERERLNFFQSIHDYKEWIHDR